MDDILHGIIEIYCGKGKGKTSAALGQAIRAAAGGRSVIVVQFLKRKKNVEENSFLLRLEPEIRLFRFERGESSFDSLTQEEKEDAIAEIRNGMNYAKKVLTTGECQVLVLDEVLGLLQQGIVTPDEMRSLLLSKDEETGVIITGTERCPEIEDLADSVYTIDVVK